ncbi:origin recognition complex, subunit 3 [Aspergillus steynii IBT 23096]|uniref:Origin recognition complex subunit 3 n=1 Tax=Aspergillus steynii IBT 23096 TaxID=1392250 RepID=A0A2I2FVQ0_9EURO|nr:origin recognition complex, subunit 3 [Aspergillus steynii IBT 23096]PLB44719.1 origin recognition complex, subunit 3 [Aspergillus steynii IBT 23096]
MDLLEDTQASSKDGTNSQGVYIYRPTDSSKVHGDRPSKRRKVLPPKQEPERNARLFAPLLNGDENPESVDLRYKAYEHLWGAQEAKIQRVLDEADSEVLENVASFVRSTSPKTYDGCIPSALVTVGSNVSSLGRLLARLNDQLISTNEGGVVMLESGDAPNLKATLKNTIRAAITNTEGNDGYQSFLNDRDGPRLLGYDLDLLGDYVQRKGVKKLVLAFRDSEAFDPNILTDLLSLLSSWLDRIPFTLLFGISTSIELFEGRLPRSTVALLKGKYFEIHEASNCVDRIYERIQAEEDGQLWIGRNITNILLEKSSDFFQTPEAFSRTVKYAYMSHFFANPLAVLLADDRDETKLQQPRLCEAIRNTSSFRRYCEDLADQGHLKQVRSLLEDDQNLFQESLRQLGAGQQRMRDMFQAVKVIHSCLKEFNLVKRTGISDLSILALSGELLDSQSVGDILQTFKTLDSTRLKALFTVLSHHLMRNPTFARTQQDLEDLLENHQSPEPLRSEYDSRHSVMATTVVQQRVKLSKGKSKLSEQDIEYTKIINRFLSLSEAYFQENLFRPQDLFLHEVFLVDMKNPLKETFAPRPRFSIERALSSPFDYLVSTSETTETKVSAKQPATAILYQLYLESGSLVNMHDLWHAFHAVFESDQGDRCDERLTMVLFYRALSELKALGTIKSSRKKVDHAAKTSWIGL